MNKTNKNDKLIIMTMCMRMNRSHSALLGIEYSAHELIEMHWLKASSNELNVV